MWKLNTATYNKSKVLVMCKGDQVQFPVFAQVAIGDTFEIGGKSCRVIDAKKVRDENILTKVEEIKDDKPTPRRARNKPSREELRDSTESGLDSSD